MNGETRNPKQDTFEHEPTLPYKLPETKNSMIPNTIRSKLSSAERTLVDELAADGLAIQHKFRPEPLYKTTGKGHYADNTVEEIRQALELSLEEETTK